jgi:NO-binding membrane sensor protein with MHYT domain
VCVRYPFSSNLRSTTSQRDREAAHLLQSALAEVAIISLIGGALSVALAIFAVHRFAGYAALAIPRTGTITVDLTVLCLSVLLTVGASFVIGMLPRSARAPR